MIRGSRRLGIVVSSAVLIAACSGGGTLSTPTPRRSRPTATPAMTDGTPTTAPTTATDITYRCSKGDGQLNGAGSTFIFPLLSKMGADYEAKCGVKLNYQSIGSGGGIKAWTENTVDFGASDAFLKDSEIQAAAAKGEPVEIPATFGAVVVAYNLKGLARSAQDDAGHHRRPLPRQDHEVERCRHRGPEPRRQPAGHRRQRRPSLGRLRHDQHLHDLPHRGEPGLGDDRRRRATRPRAPARRLNGRRASGPAATRA